MRKRDLTLAAAAVAVLLAGPAAADTVVLKPTVIDIGKWAEGIAYDGHFLWAAESGQRSVARIDLKTGRVLGHLRVGRLPVDLAANRAGDAFAMVNTDKLIYRLNPERGVLARLDGCPSAMAARGPALMALIEPDCSSATSRLVQIDMDDGHKRQTKELGAWATALTITDADAWVGHARAPALTVVDYDTFVAHDIDIPGVSVWAMTTANTDVYAGGRLGEDNGAGVVVMIDPDDGREQHRVLLSERVAEMTADGPRIVAVGEKGTIWVLAAEDLTLLRTITLSTGAFQPRGVLIQGDDLILTNSMQTGENGAVLIVSGWRP